ncbi:uncharacterized protein N0V89_012551 [Didymosphaeria variabile]|uniref:Fungal lipase-type domain-containing protein n=1 Tax=Didymosphaeria variabile TaxID=1932322 RepID=A0A9W8X9D6_9PLEO|nr:uncharacterized protein N0V89_012551 [Didymosphaeria variabile]KAJ4344807.1 hypothetical protein N0V89_012551 [Didymosphaeria variabile]
MASAFGLILCVICLAFLHSALGLAQTPLATRANDTITRELFFELEELARIVDISYCVGTAGLGIQKPFSCASHCGDEDFKDFELVTAWNTGPLFSDSCGYIALSHPPSRPRIILAFRGTYSIANTIVDLSTIPQEYVPYPGDDDDGATSDFLAPSPPPTAADEPPPADPPKCTNCTVHTGFYSSWLNTRKAILPALTEAIEAHPDYEIVLVGHSLGGAVAALAALDLKARGWSPRITTFGEPRVGNAELMAYINARFNISSNRETNLYHRVTHYDDPVPLLPLAEWGYTMHSEELFISQAGFTAGGGGYPPLRGRRRQQVYRWDGRRRPELGDYFWRLGLCVPGGDPKDWYRKYPKQPDEDVQEIDEL